MATITEQESQQIEQAKANSDGRTPLAFIHGLWFLRACRASTCPGAPPRLVLRSETGSLMTASTRADASETRR